MPTVKYSKNESFVAFEKSCISEVLELEGNFLKKLKFLALEILEVYLHTYFTIN